MPIDPFINPLEESNYHSLKPIQDTSIVFSLVREEDNSKINYFFFLPLFTFNALISSLYAFIYLPVAFILPCIIFGFTGIIYRKKYLLLIYQAYLLVNVGLKINAMIICKIKWIMIVGWIFVPLDFYILYKSIKK